MEHLHNTLIKFSQVAHEQEKKGIAKYGYPLNPHENKHDWLEMAVEELVDGFKYLHAEQVRRKQIVKEIRQAIKTEVTPSKHDEITRLLNKLEGGNNEQA